ncbi:MAG: class I SAM-dependent methyltransferase, partial [Verrucomicrobiota bacterium]
MPEEPPDPYDQIPYRGFPRRHSHPELLAAHATIFGLSPQAVESSRILEIGCGDGANLISIAASLPNAHCSGVDRSVTHIEKGQEVITGAGLANIELQQGDFTELPAPEQPYDYIIAHGVYSWISHEEQQQLLSLIKNQLAPNGVAFVSYNCYPGWNLRTLVRELMLYRTRNVEDPQQKVNIARQILPVLSGAVPSTMQGYAALLVDEQTLVNQTDDYYIAHEHLEEDNEPCHFHEFADRLDQNELQFLCEAELSSMFINRYPAALTALQTQDGDVI